MHTLLIHQAFVSPNEAGGTRHLEFIRYIIAQGNQFTIVASNVSYLTGRPIVNTNGRLTVEEQIDGIRVLRTYTYPSIHKSFVWRVISFLSFMLTSIGAGLGAGSVDVVMGTTPPLFQAVSAWLVSLLRRRPFLMEVRDLWPEFAIEMGVLTNPILIALSRWLEVFLYGRAAHLLVNSPAYADYLAEKGIRPEKITLIPNGVEPTMFDPEARGEAFRRQWELNGKVVVTYAGALGPANDIDTILRAAVRLQERESIHFLFVGDGKDRGFLQQTAIEQGLANVTFTGALPKAEMPQVLAASDICVATLKDISMFRTTYPNKVFDYMAAGRPTVLAIDGVIREVVEAARGGIYVPPGDDEALAAAVRRLADTPAEAVWLGRQARAYAVERFNRTDHAQQFTDLLSRLAGV